jgi:hypothetical protein
MQAQIPNIKFQTPKKFQLPSLKYAAKEIPCHGNLCIGISLEIET